MKKYIVAILTTGIAVLGCAAANAFTVESTIFADYTSASSSYKTQNQLDAVNGFHFTRTYLTFKDQVSDGVKVQLTFDQKDLGSVASGGAVFVKYAFADLKLGEVTTLRAGQIPTPYLYYEDSLWTYRYAFKTFADLNNVTPTTDLGLAFTGNPAEGGLGYYIGIFNGEGFQKTPNGRGFNIGGRLDYRIGNFGIVGYYSSETDHSNGAGTAVTGYNPTRAIGLLYYKDDTFTLAGQYLSADDGPATTAASTNPTFLSGTGYSFWGHTKLFGSEALRAVLRYDSIRPKNTYTVDQQTLIYGISYRIARTTEVGLFGESVSNSANISGQSDSQFSVNLLTGF